MYSLEDMGIYTGMLSTASLWVKEMPTKLSPGHKPILGQQMKIADAGSMRQWQRGRWKAHWLSALSTFPAVQEPALNKQDTSSAAFEQAGHFFCSLWTSRTLLLQPLNKQDTSSAASDTAVFSGSRQTPPSLTELQTKHELYKACHLTQTHLGQACMGPGSQSHRSGNNRDQDSGLNAVATWCSLTPRSWPSGDHHGTDHSV